MKIARHIIITMCCALLPVLTAAAQEQPTTTGDGTVRTEDYRLDIENKKISEENYEAGVRVTAGSPTEPSLRLDVGVGVRAERITVTLRGVTGDVRFRGSLGKLLGRLVPAGSGTGLRDR